MSKNIVLTSLSKRFHFTPASSLSSRPIKESEPKLILLCAWMGAKINHVQKYVNGYAALWPSTPIILIQSLPQDFRPLSRYAKDYGPLRTLLAQHDVNLLDESQGDRVLLITMSNGGCWSLKALLESFGAHAIIHPRAVIHDSCPGLARYRVTLTAFLVAGRYRLFSRAIATVVITIYYFLGVLFNVARGRDPMKELRRMLIEQVRAKRRSYIYSQEDALIMAKDVESHAVEAREFDGTLVRTEKFAGSAHVMHLRSDEARYWRVIQEAWDTTSSSDATDKAVQSTISTLSTESPSDETSASSSYVETFPQQLPIPVNPEKVHDAADNLKSEENVKNVEQMNSDQTEDLAPSILGTKEYWDNIYIREVKNHSENKEDEGEIWFGEESEDKIIHYLDSTYPPPSHTMTTVKQHSSSPQASPRRRMLDLGTGNGHLLFRLHEEGYDDWSMTGIDYSSHSIALARSIAATRQLDGIHFTVLDFLQQSSPSSLSSSSSSSSASDPPLGVFDVLLDKGTFDAISLSDERIQDKTLSEQYPTAVARFMHKDSKLIVTSCNWTREELVARLTADKVLEVHAFFKTPKKTFQFGGQVGSTTSQVVFRPRRQ